MFFRPQRMKLVLVNLFILIDFMAAILNLKTASNCNFELDIFS